MKNNKYRELTVMKMSILSDNRAGKCGILAEQGLSIFIEHDGTNVLFDTGQSNVHCRNALQTGVDLDRANYIVLSRGHYNHCGGLVYLPEMKILPDVYVHKTAFAKRYTIESDGLSYREIGIPWSFDNPKIKKLIHWWPECILLT